MGGETAVNGGLIVVGKYKVMTLCGSTRFKDEFEDGEEGRV